MNTADTPQSDQPHEIRYLEPDWFTRHVMNPAVRLLTRAGISIRGSRELRVRGRKSGEWRKTPVNLLTVDGQEYLIAPRGTTQWVRNLRAAGTGELRVGRKVEVFQAHELADADKTNKIREYLVRWESETKRFFEGLTKDATDAQIAEVAPSFPVFAIEAEAA